MKRITLFFLAIIFAITILGDNILLSVIKNRVTLDVNQEKLLIKVLSYIEKVSSEPLLVLAVMEQESTYRWTHGDSGKAIGFMQIHLATAQFIAKKYKNYLYSIGIKNLDIKTEHDLIITPIRTTILAVLWLEYNLKNTDNLFIGISRYNGINNDKYVYSVLNRYYNIIQIYERLVEQEHLKLRR